MTAKDLKNALLQEAVQGKLVPQIASEGNARDLLEEIRKEKLSHGFANSYGICGEKGKKSKSSDLRSKSPQRNAPASVVCVTTKELPDITEDEIPFEIPESWCWCRLGEVTEIARGGSPRPIKDYLTTDEDGYNWIKIGDTDKDGKYINRTAEKIKKEGLNKTRFVHKGDFLLTNSMSFWRPYILNIDGCIHDGWLVISPKDNIFNKDFLYYVLSSTFAYNQFCDSVSGAVVKNLNSDKVRESLFPLPPLAEQKRIVAAIEKFMPLIEEYGKKESELKAFNEKIGTLTKKAILQEAVQGKLVPQIASEGNAKDLLEEIRKERLSHGLDFANAKSGKRKSKKETALAGSNPCDISDDEIPFDIPENWCWCRLGEIVPFGVCQNAEPQEINDEDWILDLEDIEKDSGKILSFKTKKEVDSKSTKHIFKKGFVLYSKLRPYLNKCVIAPKDGFCTSEILPLDFGDMIYNKYAQLYLMSPFFVDYTNSLSFGVKMPRLGTEDGKKALFPLPPLAEQKRIVAAIEKMLPLCEKLGE